MTQDSFTFDFFDSICRHADTAPEDIALMSIGPSGQESYSWRRVVEEASHLSGHLLQMELQPGDRVALLIENHPRWVIAFLAVQSAAGIAVPLDTFSETAKLKQFVVHSEARVLIASPRFYGNAEEILADLQTDLNIFGSDDDWQNVEKPKSLYGTLPLVARALDDDLVILYTGGTTGSPKGVLLTQRNLYRSIADMLAVFPLSSRDRVLSVLPLFHIMPLLANALAPVFTGARVIYLSQLDPQLVLNTFTSERITAFLCVPQFYYLVQRRIKDQVERQPYFKRSLFRLMLKLSGIVRRRFGIRIGKLLFAEVHARFGKQLRALGVGGASFSPETASFFADLGFVLFQAYGLTECGGLATVTPLDRNGGFTCGQPALHTEVRLDHPDKDGCGEILIHSESVMRCYWRDPAATTEVLRDGWLHTGDLGTFTKDGSLRLTGRAKEVIVLASGKNIFPEEIEQFLQSHCPLISEVCITSLEEDASTKLHCMVVPNLEAFRDRQLSFIELQLRNEIQSLARQLPAHKRPASLQILSEPLPRTTTRKLQRFKIAALAHNGPNATLQGPAVNESADPTEREVIGVIRRIRGDATHISRDSSLEFDVHLDSLQKVELIANLETAFAVEISDAESAAFYSVADVIAAVKRATPRSMPAEVSWRGGRSILLEPFTLTEEDFVNRYLNARPLSELFWFAVVRFLRLLAALLLRFRFQTPAKWPSGGFMLCPNHLSYLDDVLVPAVLPFSLFRKLFFLGASKYFRNPILAWLGRHLRVIPVDAERNLLPALRMSRAGIEKGMVLCVFPEGTRSFDGALQKLMKGPALLAETLRVPVVPMGIAGTSDVLPRSAGFGGLHSVAIVTGPALTPLDSETVDQFNQRLTEQLDFQVKRAAEMRA